MAGIGAFSLPIQGALDQGAKSQEQDFFQLLRQLAAMPSLPVPEPAQMQFDPQALILGGLGAGILGGPEGADAYLRGNLQGSSMRQQQEQIKRDRQMQLAKVAQDREMGMLRTEADIANAKMNRAFQTARDFRADRKEDAALRQERAEKQEQTWRSFRSGYGSANSRGEKEFFARQLTGSPYAVSPDELKGDLRALAEPRINQWRNGVRSWMNTFDLNKEDRDALEAERQGLLTEFKGVLTESDVRPVPTSETLRKQKMAEQTRQFELNHKLAKDRFAEAKTMNKWRKDIQFPQQMAARWAQVEVARQGAITSAQNSDYNGARFYLQQMETLGGSIASDIQKKIDALLVERAGKAGTVVYEEVDGKKVAKRDQKAVQDIAEIDSKLNYLQGLLQEQNQHRVEAGLTPLDIPDLAQRRSQVESALKGPIGIGAQPNKPGSVRPVNPLPQGKAPGRLWTPRKK